MRLKFIFLILKLFNAKNTIVYLRTVVVVAKANNQKTIASRKRVHRLLNNNPLLSKWITGKA